MNQFIRLLFIVFLIIIFISLSMLLFQGFVEGWKLILNNPSKYLLVGTLYIAAANVLIILGNLLLTKSYRGNLIIKRDNFLWYIIANPLLKITSAILLYLSAHAVIIYVWDLTQLGKMDDSKVEISFPLSFILIFLAFVIMNAKRQK